MGATGATGTAGPASGGRAGRRVTLVSRVGCHLCDQARAVLAAVVSDLGAAWDEIDVDADPRLRAEYGDLVPVVLVDGEEHAYLHVDPADLRAALAG